MQSLYRVLKPNLFNQMRILIRDPLHYGVLTAGTTSLLTTCTSNTTTVLRHYSVNNVFIELVKNQLSTSEDDVKTKQIQLLSHVMDDINFANENLQLTGEEVYKLAVATFQASKQSEGQLEAYIYTSLFKLAHELNDNDASYTYGNLLRIGQGCVADPLTAAKIFTDLAMKGHPYAQFTLAAMYYRGEGIEQNFTKAFTLFKVSSKNLVPQAFSALGDMNMLGQGVPEDKTEAIMCYERAIELGDSSAHLSLAQCYNKGNGVEQSFEKAFEHYLAAAKADLTIGIYNTAIHYFAGKGTEHSFEKAAEYFERAADRGFTPAQVNLGNMYYNGLGVNKDLKRAKDLYKMAAVEDKNAKTLLEELEIEEQKMTDLESNKVQ